VFSPHIGDLFHGSWWYHHHHVVVVWIIKSSIISNDSLSINQSFNRKHICIAKKRDIWRYLRKSLLVSHTIMWNSVWNNSVFRLLLNCSDLLGTRQTDFTASSLKNIFQSVDNQNIIDFITATHCYRKSAVLYRAPESRKRHNSAGQWWTFLLSASTSDVEQIGIQLSLKSTQRHLRSP